MKKISSLFIGFLMVFSLSAGIATAYTINEGHIDVEYLDTFVSSSSNPSNLNNSNPSTELNWVNSILTSPTSFAYRIENDFNWEETNAQGIWAYHFIGVSPEYFLIKTGGNGSTHYLFENLNSNSYAVLDLSDFDAPGNSGGLDISGISHITAFGGSSSPPPTIHQPEPTTMFLFAIGLLGIAVVRRRKK